MMFLNYLPFSVQGQPSGERKLYFCFNWPCRCRSQIWKQPFFRHWRGAWGEWIWERVPSLSGIQRSNMTKCLRSCKWMWSTLHFQVQISPYSVNAICQMLWSIQKQVVCVSFVTRSVMSNSSIWPFWQIREVTLWALEARQTLFS